MAIELAPITSSGNAQRLQPFHSITRVEAGEHQQHEAAAVQRVRRGPDALDDRADVQPLEQRARRASARRRRRPGPCSFSAVDRGVFSHSPAHSPSIIVASVGMKLSVDQPPLVEAERRLAREQVQEPDVERPRQVRVLVEVREEARCRGAASRPARRPGVVEVRAAAADTARTPPRSRRGSRRTRATCTRSDANASRNRNV